MSRTPSADIPNRLGFLCIQACVGRCLSIKHVLVGAVIMSQPEFAYEPLLRFLRIVSRTPGILPCCPAYDRANVLLAEEVLVIKI
jgi:hypothetical protein